MKVIILLFFVVVVTAACDRTRIMQRAENWYKRGVTWGDGLVDGYLRNASGFVAMALELKKPGVNITKIPVSWDFLPVDRMNYLLPGDILLETNYHVILVTGWKSREILSIYDWKTENGIRKLIKFDLPLGFVANYKYYTRIDCTIPEMIP